MKYLTFLMLFLCLASPLSHAQQEDGDSEGFWDSWNSFSEESEDDYYSEEEQPSEEATEEVVDENQECSEDDCEILEDQEEVQVEEEQTVGPVVSTTRRFGLPHLFVFSYDEAQMVNGNQSNMTNARSVSFQIRRFFQRRAHQEDVSTRTVSKTNYFIDGREVSFRDAERFKERETDFRKMLCEVGYHHDVFVDGNIAPISHEHIFRSNLIDLRINTVAGGMMQGRPIPLFYNNIRSSIRFDFFVEIEGKRGGRSHQRPAWIKCETPATNILMVAVRRALYPFIHIDGRPRNPEQAAANAEEIRRVLTEGAQQAN